MAITFVGAGAITYSINNPAPSSPTHAVGDLLILLVGTKPDTTPATTPSGWTLLGAVSGGTGSTGVDTGPMRVGIFYTIATGTTDGPGTITITGNNVSAAQVLAYRAGAGNSLDIAGTGAADTTTGTAFTATMPLNPGLTVADELITIGVTPTDAATYSAQTVAATGMTTVTLTEVNEWATSSGQDMGGFVARGPVVTGTASAAPVLSATAAGTTTNVAGPLFLVRLREVSANANVSASDSGTLSLTAETSAIANVKSATDSGTLSVTEGSTVVPSSPPSTPTFTHLTDGGTTTDQTSYTTASISPTANNVLFLTVHTYMATGSAPPPQPTISGNAATWTLQKAQDVDNSGTDMATMWVWTAPASASPTAGVITIDFGATLVGAIAWSVEEANADASNPVANAYGVTTASGVTVATVTYTNTMGAGTAGFSAFGAQGTAGFTPKTGWTELADITTVSTCRLETQFISGQDTDASATFAASRSGGIALEVTGAPSATPKSASDSGDLSATAESGSVSASDPPISKSGSDSGTLSLTGEVATAGQTLPGLIGGVEPESHAHNPALLAPNGNLYRITESDTASGNHPMAWKSTNGGVTWTEMDSANRPTAQDLEGSWVAMDGSTLIFVVTRDDTVWWCPFNTSTDTWGTQETIDTGLSSSGVEQYASFTKNNDGTYWVFYSDTLASANNQIAYRKRTGTNTYGTKSTAIGGNTGVSYTAPSTVKGASDVTHIFYKDDTNNTVYWRTLSAAGTLSSATSVATGTATDNIPHTNPVYFDNGGTEEVFVAYADSSDILKLIRIAGGAQQTTETISTSAILMDPGSVTNGGTVAHLAVWDSTIYAMWADAATGDIKLRSRASNGTWSSVSTVWASGANEAWYVYNNIYSYGGRIKMGYVYDVTHDVDVSDLRYDEVDLGAASGTSNVSASDTGNITVTEAKTLAGSSTSTDTGNVTVTENAAIVTSIAASDTGNITGTDASTSSSTVSTSDAGNLTATEAKTLAGSSTSTDTGNITVTETAAVAITSATSDTGNLTSTETAAIANALSASDTGNITSTETSSSSSTLSTADTGNITVTESISLNIPVAATDSGSLSAVEAPNVQVGGVVDINGSDSGNITVTDSGSVVIQINVTDTGNLSVTEGRTIAGTATASDSGSISATDASTMFKSITVTDSGSISATEGAVVFNDRPGTDSGVLSVTETSQIDILGIVDITGSDSGSLSITEAKSLAASTSTTDSGNITGTESTSFVKNISSSDSGSLSATESRTVGLVVTASDSGTIASTESGSVDTAVGTIVMHAWHEGSMVDVQFHYWDGTQLRDLQFHRWDGSQFS